MTSRSFLFVLAVCFAWSTQANEFNDRVDAIFAGIDSRVDPGCSVGVVAAGQLIHRAGYGLANLELEVPLDGTHVHRIGSVSKQFTAFSVLLLAEEGRINLNDDIRKYLPALLDYGVPVSINSILGHIGGMADYDYISGSDEVEIEGGLNIESVAGGPFRIGNEDYLTIAEFYDVVKRVSLRHAPNEKYEYSNLGYFLLSMLVEEVSGETLRQYAHRRIFQPLGMDNTFFSDEPAEIVKNRASGYRPSGEGYVTDMTNLFWVGDGGLHTNIEDLAIWDQHFYNPRLGRNPEELMAQFLTPNSVFPSGDGTLYANGQNIGELDGRSRIAHGGGWLGVTTYYARYPDDQFSTIILCNDVSLSPYNFSRAIEQTWFENR